MMLRCLRVGHFAVSRAAFTRLSLLINGKIEGLKAIRLVDRISEIDWIAVQVLFKEIGTGIFVQGGKAEVFVVWKVRFERQHCT